MSQTGKTFPENLDVVGYNYQEYRYNDDHKAYPKRIIYGSENGMALSAWNAVDSNAYIAGQFLIWENQSLAVVLFMWTPFLIRK